MDSFIWSSATLIIVFYFLRGTSISAFILVFLRPVHISVFFFGDFHNKAFQGKAEVSFFLIIRERNSNKPLPSRVTDCKQHRFSITTPWCQSLFYFIQVTDKGKPLDRNSRVQLTFIAFFYRETRTSLTTNKDGFASVQDEFRALSDGKVMTLTMFFRPDPGPKVA